jgi:4-oxalomesaconate tautomerase
MTLIAPPQAGGHLATRTFVPHKCHVAIGVLGAVTVATACVIPGSVARSIVSVPQGAVKQLSVEHPTGEFSLEIELDEAIPGQVKVTRSSLIRTARALFRGEVLIPASIWDGVTSETSGLNVRTMEHA